MNDEDELCNDFQEIITQAINKIKMEQGAAFSLQKVNLAELERMTGISRGRLRGLKKNGFIVKPSALKGRKAATTVLTGFTGIIDSLLKQGISNSNVCLERLEESGFTGSLSTVKRYISGHKDLISAKRELVAPQGNRGRRYSTNPGEAYQMDWGFLDVVTNDQNTYRAACFAMICHHCGMFYVEFFPNAKQENLFIGMIHAFVYLGVPRYVLTDNMKSVVIGRDAFGHPLWNTEYESFMKTIGFQTKLCKPRHPFTKGKVERLIRYVKGNFMAGRVFGTITDLNYEALRWCEKHNHEYHQQVDCIPADRHADRCRSVAKVLENSKDLHLSACVLQGRSPLMVS
ncbi:MAG: IS21 family transposase [Bilifractor sp.]